MGWDVVVKNERLSNSVEDFKICFRNKGRFIDATHQGYAGIQRIIGHAVVRTPGGNLVGVYVKILGGPWVTITIDRRWIGLDGENITLEVLEKTMAEIT